MGGEPLLITKVSFIFINRSQINLQFTLKNHKSLELELNFATLARIRLLLNELNNKAHWDLADQSEMHHDLSPTNQVIH